MKSFRLTFTISIFVAIMTAFTAFAQSTVTISETRGLKDGTMVTVEGIAITPSLESNLRTSFFIQNGNAGINVFKQGTPAKLIEAGDFVTVTGELTTFNGLREIVVSDIDTHIVVQSTGNVLPDPRVVTFEELQQASNWESDSTLVQSTLVRFDGLTTDPYSWPADSIALSTSVMALDAVGHQVTIRLMSQTEVISLFPPDNFDLIAVVGSYNSAQLIPRFNSDVLGESYNVSFQVDMNEAIDSAQFIPDEHEVFVVGSFNGWSADNDVMVDEDSDGIYTKTLNLPSGSYMYKYYAATNRDLEWENGPNKELLLTEDIVLPANPFEAEFRDLNGATLGMIDLHFKVNMLAQEQLGNFNPDFEQITVTGNFDQQWDYSAYPMMPTEEPGVYEAFVSFQDEQVVPKTTEYKFTIVREWGEAFWEEFDGNRLINVYESDFDSVEGYYFATNFADSIPYFSNQQPIEFPEEISIAEARDVAAGELVTVRGIVTRAFDVYANIQQDTAALLIYTSSGAFFEAIDYGDVAMGDSVLLTGYRTDYNGQKEIVDILQYEVLSRENTLPAPAVLTVAEFHNSGNNYQSELIQINSLSILGQSQFYAGQAYTANVSGTDEIVRFVVPRGAVDRLGGQPIPEVFNFVGVAGYSSENAGNHQQLIGIEGIDVVEVQPPLDMLPIPNGSFELSPFGEVSGFTPGWFAGIELISTAQATFEITGEDVYAGNKALKVTVNELGAEIWHIQAVNNEFDVLTDQLYTLSVWAKTDTPGSTFSFTVGNADYFEYGRIHFDHVNLTEEWQKIEFPFMVYPDDSINVGNLQRVRTQIMMNYDQNLNSTIYLDYLEIMEGGQVVDPSAFEGELGSDSLLVGVDDTETLPIHVLNTNGVPIEAFQFTLSYDPSMIDITIPDQTGTMSENFTIEMNEPVPGMLVVSAASTEMRYGTGVLMNLEITGLSEGEDVLDFINVAVNESWVNDFYSDLYVGTVFLCGDVSADGNVTATDASYVLRHTVFLAPQYPLSGVDSTAADVTGNGWISAYDASQILKYDAGLPAIMQCSPVNAKAKPLFAELSWEALPTENNVEVSFFAENIDGEVLAAEMSIPLIEGLKFTGFKNAPENWQVYSNQSGNVLYISMFGAEAVSQPLLGSVQFERTGLYNGQTLQAEVILNENDRVALEPLAIADIPNEFELHQNYPNPFNPSTQIKYSVPEEAKVQLIVYNLLGQKVAELVNESMSPGRYTVSWDAGSLSSGVYMYRLVAGDQVFTKKMMLIK